MAPIPDQVQRFGKRIAKRAGEAIMAMSEVSEPPTSGALHVQIGSSDDVDESIAAEIVSLTLFDTAAEAVGETVQDGAIVLTAGYATVAQAEAAEAIVTEQHGHLVVSTSIEAATNEQWVQAQRAGLEPTTIGPWHIRAPWHPEPQEVELLHDIEIDPGAAFGHGAHPSTRIAIELMLRHLPTAPETTSRRKAEHTVVDLGTGTGVAAIIAARLGAKVRATEIDPVAGEVAWLNIERNSSYPFDHVVDLIDLRHGDAADAEVDPSDLVVANVTIDVHRRLVENVSRAHRIVVSGILCRQVRALQDLYSGHRPSTILTYGEWAGIEFLSFPASEPKEL